MYVEILENSFGMGIQILRPVNGQVKTIFTAPLYASIFDIAVSPDATQLLLSYTPPPDAESPTRSGIYVMPLDGSALRNRSSCRPWKLMKIFKRNGHRMANTFTIQTPTTQHRNRKIVSPRYIRFSVWRTQVAHRKKSKKTRCGPVSLRFFKDRLC